MPTRFTSLITAVREALQREVDPHRRGQLSTLLAVASELDRRLLHRSPANQGEVFAALFVICDELHLWEDEL